MTKNVLQSIAGADVFAIFSLLLFVAVFVLMLFFVRCVQLAPGEVVRVHEITQDLHSALLREFRAHWCVLLAAAQP